MYTGVYTLCVYLYTGIHERYQGNTVLNHATTGDTLEPRYKLPSQKYFSNTVIPIMIATVRDSISEKFCDINDFSFTTDIWSTNVASDSLLSLLHTGLRMTFKGCLQF